MERDDREEDQLRSVAIQNANSILVARQRAEQQLLEAKQALEIRTAELARSLSMMRATLESTTDGILVTDQAGGVTSFNENYLKMWGVSRELAEAGHHGLAQAQGRRFLEPAPYFARIAQIYESALSESHDVLTLSDGQVIERFSKVQFVEQRDVGRVWIFRDITQSRRAEQERLRLLDRERAARADAERASEMKDEFLATLSHELRTPLSAILGWSVVLRQNIDDDKILHGLEAIERSARIQTQLIEDLLDMSRITAGTMRLDVQPADPALFIEAALETVRPAADAKGIRLDKRIDPGAGPISGDPARLQQVMWNLLSNAIKFTPRNGRIQVILERVNSHIEISVADTGIGIEPDFLPRVFDRFRQADATITRSFGGLGLGLAIVKNLVELHGGTVRVSSGGQDLGTTFTVQLPLAIVHRDLYGDSRRHPSTPKDAALGFTPVDLAGCTVLVVDDESDARNLMRVVLEGCGARVISAGTAVEALARLEHETPDVLVSDIGMPAMDGYELIRRVRELGHERNAKLPAIALTAFARTEDRTRALRAGYLVHMAKPVEPSELVATIANIFRRPTGAA